MRKEMLLRIEEELYEAIKKIADKQERSVNAQICYIIKKYIEEKEQNEKDNN